MKGKRLLIEYLRRNWFAYVAAISIMACAQVIHSLFPYILGNFTDELQAERLNVQGIRDYALLLLAVGVGYGVLFGVGQYSNHRLGRVFEYQTRQKLFSQFTRLSETVLLQERNR